MSAFLHQIFYANNKFGSDSPDDPYAFVEELSKWSIPKPIFITPNDHVILSYDGVPIRHPDTPASNAITFEDKSSSVIPQTPTQVVTASLCPGILQTQNPLPKTSTSSNINMLQARVNRRIPSNSPTQVVPPRSLREYSNSPTQVVPPCFENNTIQLRSLVPRSLREYSNLSIFQSIFLLHYGYSEYIMAGNRMLNRELEEKQKIMETLSKMPKKLKEGNHKLTNDNIQEILSGLLVATKEEIMHLVAYSAYYKCIIYLVFTHSYLVFSPTKEVSVDSTNIQSVYILNQTRKHPKYGGSYYPDLEPTLEKLENIHNSKIHLEHYAKPFKGVSAYKLQELEEMATKVGLRCITGEDSSSKDNEKSVSPVKYKKKDLYDKIVEVCCAGICA